MESPFVSIIVPTRDRPGELRRALASIACQSSGDFEVIVVDDGSSEQNLAANRALLSEFDQRFSLLSRNRSEPQHGPGAARNAGIRVACGRYVGFLDDDNYWCDPEHLALAHRALGARSDADVYIAGQIGMRGETVVVPSWLPHLERLVADSCDAQAGHACEVRRTDLLRPQGIGFAHVNMCIARRENVLATRGFWTGIGYEEDLDFFLRLVDASGPILYRADTVSVQVLRDDGAPAGASSLDPEARLVLRMAACQHALLECRRPEVRAYARLLLAGALKTLARRSHVEGKRGCAADLALQAVGVNPSLRWILIAAHLRMRALLGAKTGGTADE